MPEDVLDHDHGRIDDDAEVDRPHRQQVRRVAPQHQHHDTEEQGKRDRRRHDERTPQVAEEHPLNGEDQEHPEDQVVEDRVGGDVDELAAIVVRHDLDTRGQDPPAIDALHLGLDAAQHVQRLLAPAHQDDALDDIVVVIPPGDPEARGRANLRLGHVPQEDRHAAHLRQDDVVDVVDRGDEPDPPNVRSLLADVQGAGPDVEVAVADRGDDLGQRHVLRGQLLQVDLDVVFLAEPPPADDVVDARNGLEPALEHPGLQRLQVHEAIAGGAYQL